MGWGLTNEAIRITMIEDNPGDARYIEEVLRDFDNFDFDLCWADRLSKGLEVLSEGNTDLILLDLMLPDSQEIETLRLVLEHSADVPVIVMTASNDVRLGITAVKEGARDYFVKDELPAGLLERTIRQAIGGDET